MQEEFVESKLEFISLLALSELLCYKPGVQDLSYLPPYCRVHVPQVTRLYIFMPIMPSQQTSRYCCL